MPIELNERQSAEPGRCGSCNYYRSREPGDGFGQCDFKLPPWVAEKRFEGESDSWTNVRTVRDTDGCSLYGAKRDGDRPAQFVQKRYWHAGQPR